MTIFPFAAIDLQRHGVTPCIDVMQDDKYSRTILFGLSTGGILLELPDGITAVIHYSKPDGTGGVYDKLPNGEKAYAYASNSIMVKLAPQVCTVPGLVKLSVALHDGESVLHTFAIHINVHPTPGINVKSEDYVNADNVQTKIIGIDVAEDAAGVVTITNTLEGGGTDTIVITPDANGDPSTLTYNGTVIPISWSAASAEASATGEAAE